MKINLRKHIKILFINGPVTIELLERTVSIEVGVAEEDEKAQRSAK